MSARTPTRMLAHRLALGACIALALSLSFGACAPEVGDDCETGLDCSAAGTRLCDRTQPGGYCTIQGCEKGTCPEEAVCVQFRPESARLSVTYCMYHCEDNGDCRTEDGYACMSAKKFTENALAGGGGGERMTEAKVLDGSKKKFCAYRVPPPEVDAGAIMSSGE